MTWNAFFIALIICYSVYYTTNILYDLIWTKSEDNKNEPLLLGFAQEDLKPIVVDENYTIGSFGDKKRLPDDSVEPINNIKTEDISDDPLASDGVDLNELVQLFRKKAIVFSSKHDFAA